MPLGEYRRKRLPGGTPEPIPEGDPEHADTEEGVFVVHVHAARHLHYDLRLESGGALLSFALPKGVSLDPDVRHLAVRTEDHPLEYVDFEDTIPAGQYGAGSMIAWDRGLVRWLELPAERQVARGKLDFVLYGRKLRGRFSLIPLKDKPNYLLLKKKDAFSRRGEGPADHSVLSGLSVSELPQRSALCAALRAFVASLHGIRPRTRAPVLVPRGPAPSTAKARAESRCDFVPAGSFRVLLIRRGLLASVQDEHGVDHGERHPDLIAALRHALVDDFAIEALLFSEPQPELRSPELPCQALLVDVLTVFDHDCSAVPIDVRRELGARMFPGPGIVRAMPPFAALPALLLDSARALAPAFLGVLGRSTDTVTYLPLDASAPFEAPSVQAAPKVLARTNAVRTQRVTQTNRGKPYFPGAGLSKGDLLDYYDRIADTLLPYVRNRPVILERFPDGVDGKHFFQWRPPKGAPSWLGSVEIAEHRAGHVREFGKDAKRAFLLEDRDSLLYVANLGCIPLHQLAFDPREPTLCTFATIDFDVKQASLDMARPLVRDLRRMLEHAELPSYLKTSGKSGLHVLVPLGDGIPFVAAHALVDLLGRWLTTLHPQQATREGSIDKRGQRVYVDVAQTGAVRAIAAPYSVRPVQDARISMPVPWERLDTLDPAEFTTRTVPGLVEQSGDPWAGFRGPTPDLKRALLRLEELAAGQSRAIS